MELITNIIVYPSSLTNNRLDARCPWNKPFMLIAFDYIREPETNEAIIKEIEQTFKDTFDNMTIKPISIRDILTSRQKLTTYFKNKISLS